MPLSSYGQFQSLPASEKIGLITIDAGQRGIGWLLNSGSVYRLDNFTDPVVISIQDSGIPYVSVSSIGAVTPGCYFFDRLNKKIYIQSSDSSHPNSRFLIIFTRMFFSNVAVNAPWDLNLGYDVEWMQSVSKVSEFGLELDQMQVGVAIEGSGTITLGNDQSFWKSRFDSLFFENQLVSIYSWNRQLPITEAKVIFRGSIQSKKYTPQEIEFTLKDILNGLRGPVVQPLYSTISGARVTLKESLYYQRRIYGYKKGLRVQTTDMVLPDKGYPMAGTSRFYNNSNYINGTGTNYNNEATKDDLISYDQIRWYKVASYLRGVLYLTENFTGTDTFVANQLFIKPSIPRNFTNRTYHISSHPLHEPTTTITAVNSPTQFIVADSTGIFDGDILQVGTYNNIKVLRVSGNTIKIASLLVDYPTVPSIFLPNIVGLTVKRYAVQSVYIDGIKVNFSDYTYYNSSPSILYVGKLAELNTTQPKLITGTISSAVVSGVCTVTGVGTKFTSEVAVSDWIVGGITSPVAAQEILSIESDTSLTLRNLVTITAGYGVIYSPSVITDSSAISIDVYGTTDTGLSSGVLIQSGPEIVLDILKQAGLSSNVNSASFITARDNSPLLITLAIPEVYTANAAVKMRDVINKINASCMGALVLDQDFNFMYTILTPERPLASATLFNEVDILKLAISSASDKIINQANITYDSREYDPSTKSSSFKLSQSLNRLGTYAIKVDRQKDIDTYLRDQTDALIVSQRYSFLYELGRCAITVSVKLKGSRLHVTDKVDINHEKLFYRLGSTGSRKLAEITKITKSIIDSNFDLDDLANAFSRCGVITLDTAPNWAASQDVDKLYSGYVTDNYGLIGNSKSTYNINLQW